MKTKGGKKRPTVSKLKKELDLIFSRYIRNKYAVNGSVQCVTCLEWGLIKEMQAGHYVTRGRNPLRYDERNVFPQDVGCNVFQHGNMPAYTLFLIDKFGAGIIETLVKESKAIKQYKVPELEELIELYKSKLEALTTND